MMMTQSLTPGKKILSHYFFPYVGICHTFPILPVFITDLIFVESRWRSAGGHLDTGVTPYPTPTSPLSHPTPTA